MNRGAINFLVIMVVMFSPLINSIGFYDIVMNFLDVKLEDKTLKNKLLMILSAGIFVLTTWCLYAAYAAEGKFLRNIDLIFNLVAPLIIAVAFFVRMFLESISESIVGKFVSMSVVRKILKVLTVAVIVILSLMTIFFYAALLAIKNVMG